MRFHRNAIWLIPLSLIVTFPIWSIPLGTFLTPRGGFDDDKQSSEQHSHNFNMDTLTILENQQGKTTAFIRAAKARTADNPDILEMDSVDADLYDEEGNITHIVARQGQYNTLTKILTLIDDVVVNKKIDNQFLYTDLLHYDSEQRTVKCPTPTRLVGDKVQIDGGSLEYDIKTQTYVIDNRVNCVLNGFVEP